MKRATSVITKCPMRQSRGKQTITPLINEYQAKAQDGGASWTSNETSHKGLTIRDIPGPSLSLPLIGNSWMYSKIGPYSIEKIHDANFDKYQRYGRICKEEFSKNYPMVNVYDPEDFETVLRNQGKKPFRPILEALRYHRLSQPEKYNTAGLVNEQGDTWYELRNALTPVLMKMKTITGYLAQQNDVCRDFLSLVDLKKDQKTNIVYDVQQYLYRMSLESVSMLCLDTRLGCLDPSLEDESEASEMIRSAQELFMSFERLNYGLPWWKLFNTPGYKLLYRSETFLYNTASKYIDRALKKLPKPGDGESDRNISILESLILANSINPKDIRMTIIDFIIAGIDTMSNTLSFTLYQIAKNPRVQAELYKEINRVAPNKAPLTTAMLNDMPYMKATIKEVFRINPTIPGTARIIPCNLKLSGYEVPKDTPVFCHTMVASKIPEYFAEPESMIPERWIGENKKQIHPFAVLPFGYGTRMCVGRRFAEQEIYTSVACILQHYDLELAQETLGSIYRFLIIPDRKLNLKFNFRT